MRWDKVHQGNMRQGPLSEEEIKAAEEQDVTPGVNPDLHAPTITHPGDEQETNLHGDIEGSPFGRNPGEKSMEEAEAESKANAGDAASDDDATRAREVKSRKTGRSTEALAAEDDDGGKGKRK